MGAPAGIPATRKHFFANACNWVGLSMCPVAVTMDRPYKMGSDYIVINTDALEAGEHILSLDSGLMDPFGTSVSGNKSITFTVE